jgi:hypothetical protein
LTRRIVLAAVAAAALATLILVQGAGARMDAKGVVAAGSGCQLNSAKGNIKHVIYIQFDNTHLLQDNPNVPSDLQQMPHLLNFLENNGTVINKHHTILISHTAGGILSSLTGLYPDRNGQTVSNSYDYYRTNPANGIYSGTFTSSFKYWTAPVSAPLDTKPNMVNGDSGTPQNTPAPWVSYTRAGCDVGNVSVANTVLENNNAVLVNGGPTSLAAAAAAGSSNIKVASVTGLTPGKAITIDTGTNAESAVISTTGTVGAGGTGLTLTAPLTKAHAIGVTVYGPTSTDPTGDMTTIFGEGSPEWNEGRASQTAPPGTPTRALAQADFVGIAVHCGQSDGSVCVNNTDARNDPLPDEPGQYLGFKALFGAKYVNPAITHGAHVVNDTTGTPIADPTGNPGFPGFDGMPAAVTLGYVEQMQKAGIPVTYAYISDAHDNHAGFGAYGPGEAGYVAELKRYDDAFATFFQKLADDGIDKSNTLFVFTADEGDHYAGQQAQGCDGVSTPCTYNTAAPGSKPAHGIFDLTNGAAADSSTWTPPAWPPASQNGPLVGEVGMDLKWLFGTMPAGYDISFDSAPSFYIDGQPQAVDSSGHIALNPTLRTFEQRAASVRAFDPYINTTQLVPVANYLVDAPTLKALHMINADPQRTMSFTMFSKPEMYFQSFSPCPGTQKACVSDSFAYIHGDYAPEIGQTWLGMVGPGVESNGIDNTTWSDHTDIAPTILALVGLKTDYQPDGRVISEPLAPWAVKGDDGTSMRTLGEVYKQVNAPYGEFAHSLIVASTNGIASSDSAYLVMEQKIQDLTTARDALAAQMKDALQNNDPSRAGDQAQKLIRQGRDLLAQAQALA